MIRFKTIVLFLLLSSSSMMLKASNFAGATISIGDDNSIKLKQTTAYGIKVVQVSFDAEDVAMGSFQIVNSANKVVYNTPQAELIKSPSYFTVDISEFESGDYTFIIKTTSGTYSCLLTIK